MSATIHVENFAGYLTGLCQIENRVDNVFYFNDFPHGLERLEEVFGIIPVQR